jgi:hypothetical protein
MRCARHAFSLVAALSMWAAALPPQAWGAASDAEPAAELLGRLLEAMEGLLADPGLAAQQRSVTQQREHDAAVVTVREALRLGRDLARRLDGGYSLDESRPFWERMAALRPEIRAYARHSWLPESARAKANAARELMDALEKLYAEG